MTTVITPDTTLGTGRTRQGEPSRTGDRRKGPAGGGTSPDAEVEGTLAPAEGARQAKFPGSNAGRIRCGRISFSVSSATPGHSTALLSRTAPPPDSSGKARQVPLLDPGPAASLSSSPPPAPRRARGSAGRGCTRTGQRVSRQSIRGRTEQNAMKETAESPNRSLIRGGFFHDTVTPGERWDAGAACGAPASLGLWRVPGPAGGRIPA